MRDHPRIRGEHPAAERQATVKGGIIPAYAGSTPDRAARPGRPRDHPRIRGEHGRELVGSRGSQRIIPAYAGSTRSIRQHPRRPKDHPRIRGEHESSTSRSRPSPGSSPHTRGARRRPGRPRRSAGIIPAYAGSTPSTSTRRRAATDHPRIRGEHSSQNTRSPGCRGSSPHTRGARTASSRTGVRRGDHPRIRGEHVDDGHRRGQPRGSSPHTRGARSGRVCGRGRPGIIPAYAGSTAHREGGGPGRGDHPRIRGEHERRIHFWEFGVGSSPHTRGARPGRRRRGQGARIIPAYAGSTAPRRTGRFGCTDHPRIRGEHPLERHAVAVDQGSSPHTRGAQSPSALAGACGGIIPAYAGSTLSNTVSCRHLRDHPRIRGEHQTSSIRRKALVGSSPHTRGALDAPSPLRSGLGIIPAYAGSTGGRDVVVAVTADHPRIRGEHKDFGMPIRRFAGSSPHTRGAHAALAVPRPLGRIIPAYAGSTGCFSFRGASSPDHPRIRGEHSWRMFSGTVTAGSSPHTRGARRPARHPDPRRGIIPAYAGSTAAGRWPPPTRTDHPRIRGEHRLAQATEDLAEGSSPHTRGAPCRRRSWRAWSTDHPRIRGEHFPTPGGTGPCQGSSPHTRGAHLGLDQPLGQAGIIPAYAGSTQAKPKGCDSNSDHPRIRGEHVPVGRPGHEHDGIIPAYAGSTAGVRPGTGGGPDHPRIRGEHHK